MIGYWLTMALVICAIAAVVAAATMDGIGDAPSAREGRAPSSIGLDDSDAIEEGTPDPAKEDTPTSRRRMTKLGRTASTRMPPNLRT